MSAGRDCQRGGERGRRETNHGLISMRGNAAVQLSRENVQDSKDDDRCRESDTTK
jgi:hypothetical protein